MADRSAARAKDPNRSAPGAQPAPGPVPELRRAAERVRALLAEATARSPSDCLLLSGGLDTAILAPLAHAGGTRAAVTVLTSRDAPDGPFARRVARGLGWDYRVVVVPLKSLLEETELVVRTMRTFDPMEVRNSLVIARGLREADRLGYRSILTGDGADELFGGYSFLWEKDPPAFEEYTRNMAATMRFSSTPLGRSFGIDVRAPFTDPEVVRFAVGLPKRLKVGRRRGQPVGKWVLRWAFPECPSRWRRKDPIEVGSGSTRLPEWIGARTDPASLQEEIGRAAREDRVALRDAEQARYYQTFRRLFRGSFAGRSFGPGSCAQCGFDLPRPDSTFCTTCGAYWARSVVEGA
ncbi:MAG TPA: asparagine synthase-related protein [Thermoplasmata archaeon]|nr:asparagine synthase-related protein [Thermoplasmata archaeon]